MMEEMKKMEKGLLALMKKGGLSLYGRHGTATEGVDQPYGTFYSCQYQRNLSEQGRREAVYFGQMLRYWQIPILSPIAASPFCRTIETARLAFPNYDVQIVPFLYDIYKLGGNLPSSEQTSILTALSSMLEIIPPQRMNRVIIGHSFPRDVGLGILPDMGTVVIRPKGPGQGYDIVEKLTLEDLAKIDSI